MVEIKKCKNKKSWENQLSKKKTPQTEFGPITKKGNSIFKKNQRLFSELGRKGESTQIKLALCFKLTSGNNTGKNSKHDFSVFRINLFINELSFSKKNHKPTNKKLIITVIF